MQYNDGGARRLPQGRNDEYAIGYYLKKDLGFLPAAADGVHALRPLLLLDPGLDLPEPPLPVARRSRAARRTTRSRPAAAGTSGRRSSIAPTRAGVSVRYYVVDLPFAVLYGSRGLGWVRPIEQYYADAAAGKLPNIAFVDPPFLDGGGGDGLSGDEHPHGDIRIGQAFMAEVAHAFMESPKYRRGRCSSTTTSGAGSSTTSPASSFPTTAPPGPRARTSDHRLPDPGAVISPFTGRGGVSHMTVTHESILKLISYRFGLGYLNTRHRYASRSAATLRLRASRPRGPRPAATGAAGGADLHRAGPRPDRGRGERREGRRGPRPGGARASRRPARLRGPPGDRRARLP